MTARRATPARVIVSASTLPRAPASDQNDARPHGSASALPFRSRRRAPAGSSGSPGFGSRLGHRVPHLFDRSGLAGPHLELGHGLDRAASPSPRWRCRRAPRRPRGAVSCAVRRPCRGRRSPADAWPWAPGTPPTVDPDPTGVALISTSQVRLGQLAQGSARRRRRDQPPRAPCPASRASIVTFAPASCNARAAAPPPPPPPARRRPRPRIITVFPATSDVRLQRGQHTLAVGRATNQPAILEGDRR